MDEGTEAEPVTPAAGEVRDVDVGIAGSLPLAPDQQSFPGRQQGAADQSRLSLSGSSFKDGKFTAEKSSKCLNLTNMGNLRADSSLKKIVF